MAGAAGQENDEAPSELPSFHNGDVVIVIHADEVYQLHSDVLRRCSPNNLRQLVAPEHVAQLVKAAVNGGCFTRYRLVLESSEKHPNGEIDKYGRIVADRNQSMLANAYSTESPAYVFESWRNLFCTFDTLDPDISGSSLQTVLEKVSRLMDTADSVGAAATVCAYINNSPMRQDQLLYGALLPRPIPWGNQTIRTESQSILKDAVIHVVGR
ncbi:hypothetical protein TSTA_113710 [Talaromyces stipitatus ATCC 10500]|uniref:Uncharacterized protein n=1 Tax=Talaromyces stipitatus (strain ATCC 10500 / CBS 375.48 / QM 6759 / NRRL 1006) TaxID=441959 RepID=B8MD24_TALSN|nr:uncharacterized protein TSTA_113710 [Talaromyces stipitatus ATCC 10500]EED17550.1 hypothetical protein TSTA_113710 [Talaromyces stipitatus ATCC 10500]